MGWLEKLKEKAQEHIILGLFGLIVLLLLIVWQAVPSTVWGKVSEVTPKRVLWALLGLESIVIVLETAYILSRRKRLGATSATKYNLAIGVFWDDDLHPLCPIDSTPLYIWSYTESPQPHNVLRCPKCSNRFPLRHDFYGYLTLFAAKETIHDHRARDIPL